MSEATTIIARRQSSDAGEHSPKCPRVAIPASPRNFVDRFSACLQNLAGSPYTQMLSVFNRCKPRGLMEVPKKCPLFQSGPLRHVVNRHIAEVCLLKPMLDLQNPSIAMRQPRSEDAVVALLSSRRIYQHIAGSLQHRSRAQQSIDDLESQIGPRHQASCCDDVAVIDNQLVGVHVDSRKAA